MFGGTPRAPPGSANCGLGDAPYIQGRSRCLERGDAHRRAATQHNSAELESVQHQACRIVMPCSATPSVQARVSQWSRSRTCIHLPMRRSGVQIPLWADFSFAFLREIVRGARGLVGILFAVLVQEASALVLFRSGGVRPDSGRASCRCHRRPRWFRPCTRAPLNFFGYVSSHLTARQNNHGRRQCE